jgi:PKD repeat protein
MIGHIVPRIFDVDIDDFVHGISLIGVNAPYQTTQPVISNIRVRNTTNSLRPVGIGIFVQDIARISVVNDSLIGYQEGLKFINTQAQFTNQPTISNIRVRNTTNAIRNTGTGIYGSPNVNMAVNDCVIQNYGVGVHALQNASDIKHNLFVDNDNAVLIQGVLPGFELSYNDMVLTPSYYLSTGAAIKADDVPVTDIHNNTIVNYPSLLWAQNSALTFQQNIGWGLQPLALPFVSTASTIEAIYNDINYSGVVYPGTGNFNADPLFIDAGNLDFNLHYNSPCIDAGNPAMPRDPDGTLADVGAHIYEHYSAFSSDLRFVLPNTPIQFSNQSIGHPSGESQFYWDFNSDRNTDSTLENPVWTFAELGRYNISLRIVSGNLVDTLVLYNFILVQNALLPPPQNVHIVAVENEHIRLTWDPVTHDLSGNPITPTYYIVYSNPWPSGQFRFQGLTPNVCEYTHSEGAVKQQMYYVVIGFVGSRADLNRYLQRQPCIEILPDNQLSQEYPNIKK